jgi:Tfp pilus assembly protein PilO
MVDRGIRNTILSILATALIVITGAWVQINSRISVLEVQVQNDHYLFVTNQQKAEKDMCLLIDKINDIQLKVTRLSDTKADKKYIE